MPSLSADEEKQRRETDDEAGRRSENDRGNVLDGALNENGAEEHSDGIDGKICMDQKYREPIVHILPYGIDSRT